MKKTAVVLLFLFVLLPLNAQRMIKYITFYPVPYGSHASLTVANEFMINMGTDTEDKAYKTEIEGDFSVAKESAIEGFADIRGEGTLTTTGTVRSGNDADAFGVYESKAYSTYGTTYLRDPNQTLQSLTSTSSSSFNASKTFLNEVNLGNLSACASGAQWRSLRLKGSQDCKMYLTCGGSGENTGCTTPIFSCKRGYCMENGVCVLPKSTTRTCSSAYANAVSGTQNRTASCTGSGWTYGSWYGKCTCASGYSWNSYSGCTCQPDKVYCQGMPITVAQASTCYHGIWSSTKCSGICCCLGDTPKLMSNGTPACVGTDSHGLTIYKSACVCQTKGSNGLIVN
ncbi:hypothetical protein [Candidatus Proelusimicrobium excrementi]|uniref:hypothetical protein n=1 Tax=Candidatus Proelusimicrobium excrementi TaxID=3416222 RepID=UPI003D14F7BD